MKSFRVFLKIRLLSLKATNNIARARIATTIQINHPDAESVQQSMLDVRPPWATGWFLITNLAILALAILLVIFDDKKHKTTEFEHHFWNLNRLLNA